jgi:1-deoxy-D-xylulose-5-phosphate synthase
MVDFSLSHGGPSSIRYPKAPVEWIERPVAPVELGRAEVLGWGNDGMIIAYGTLLGACRRAADRLRTEGLDVGLINARFAKPIDEETILRAIRESGFVLTVEEGTLAGGFGSAVLEAANAARLDTRHVARLGIPDRFIDHAERHEQLHELQLDAEGVYTRARIMAAPPVASGLLRGN